MAFESDLKMNIDFDLSTSIGGDLQMASDTEDVIQSSVTNILLYIGELSHYPDYGNTVFNERIKMSDSGFVTVESDSRDAILQDERVDTVDSITATQVDGEDSVVSLEYTMTLTDGRQVSNSLKFNIGGVIL